MRRSLLVLLILTFASTYGACAQQRQSSGNATSLLLPYAEAGLSERQAAAFLLDRLAYGPLPGEVDEVVAMGLERWIEDQLRGEQADAALNSRLAGLDAYQRDLRSLVATYRPPKSILREAIAVGRLPDTATLADDGVIAALAAYRDENGMRGMSDLRSQLITQKIFRARYGSNQLREVLTDFWFNHFNVDARGSEELILTLDFEREAIRPNVLGRFRDLLGATARHPAMLEYLDNKSSRAAEGVMTAAGSRADQGGINENYARELMELHTLGVEGGYSQEDVVEVARAFTGWTTFGTNPNTARRDPMERRNNSRANRDGRVQEGNFSFRPNWHDAEPKTILGMEMPAGRGIEDGEAVLDFLAGHEATAQFIARKLAIRFVADEPEDALVDRLADVFTESDGDIPAVIRALVNDVAFWQAAEGPTKVKTPFEYVATTLRATSANVQSVRGLASRLSDMGEAVYHCGPPTGFPDKAPAWVNAGALLNRMNFGLHLALGAIRGVDVDLEALNQNREPESVEAALETYAAILLPGRDLEQTLALLLPLVQDRNLVERVDNAAQQADTMATPDMNDDGESDSVFVSEPVSIDDEDTVAFVVGVILGSPQFQRQ